MVGGAIGAMMGHFGKCSSGTCPLTANPFRGAIFGALLGALFSLSFSRIQNESLEPTPKSAALVTNTSEKGETNQESALEAMIYVNNEADFKNHVLEAHLPCLANFFSDSCPTCRMLAPTMETLGSKYKGKAAICKVAIDHAETRALAQQYRITVIPAVLFLENGKETQRLVGLRSEEEYTRILDKMVEKTPMESEE
jgi:thioredoxin 1